MGGRAGGDAWTWAVGLRERPTICAHVGRKMRSIIKIYLVLEAILIDMDVTPLSYVTASPTKIN
jgi:hypothetical protein